MNPAEPALDAQNKSSNNAVSEQERELARIAHEEYSKCDYQSCAASLAKLEVLRPQDFKVTHNKIIMDYFKSNDPRKTEILKKSLNAICGQAGNSQENEDVEKSVSKYNQAVILYHSRQYQAALEIVNNLFSFSEQLEESFVHKVCLLLVELHLTLGKPDTALTLVNYIESQFISTTDASKSALGEQSPIQKHETIMKSTTKTQLPLSTEKEQKKDSMDAVTEAFRIKLLKYKLRIYLKTLQLKLCKKEWKTLISLGMPTDLTTIFLKANLEYLRKNYKKAMKLLNTIDHTTCPNFKACGESIALLYYNNIASLHFAMGKPNLSSFYLRKALEENKKAVDNGKTESTNNSTADSLLPLYALGKNKHYEIMYSLGVSLLYSGQATKAFDCFIEAAQQLHNNPRLWLRMAECCILCHNSSNKIDFDIPGRRKDIVEKVIGDNNGSGISRKFVLTSSLSKNCKYHTEGLSYAIPQTTLEYGMLCLKNARFLLQLIGNDETKLPFTNLQQDGSKKNLMGQQQSSLLGSLASAGHKLGNNSNPVINNNSANLTHTELSQSTIIENLNLKISILTASAYISLCLGDYTQALEYSKSLLSIKKLPGAHWLLGNLYAAESLVFLDRIYEALEHLKPDTIQDVNTYLPVGEVIGDKDKIIEEIIEQKPSKVSWYPTNIATAKSILKYNLAVAYAYRGELDKSGEILKQVWTSKGPDCDVPIHVIMLALYIELQLGHVDIARSLIKQHYSPT